MRCDVCRLQEVHASGGRTRTLCELRSPCAVGGSRLARYSAPLAASAANCSLADCVQEGQQAGTMREGQGEGVSTHQRERDGLVVEEVEQRASRHQVGHDQQPVLFGVDGHPEQQHEVRVVELDHRVDLTAERVHLIVSRRGRRQHLDGDRRALPRTLPNDAERAAPDLGADRELSGVDTPRARLVLAGLLCELLVAQLCGVELCCHAVEPV